MTKRIELRRHTDNDGDRLSEAGVQAAVAVGTSLTGSYELVVSSGAQRATQAAACFLAGMGQRVPGGVAVDDGLRSEQEDQWRAAFAETGSGHLRDFLRAAPDLVHAEGARFAAAVRRVAERLSANGRALVIGHSPMHEAAVYALTGETIDPLGKGQGIVLVLEADQSAHLEQPE